jgi:hypothetical protein
MRILDEESREAVTVDYVTQTREQMLETRETYLDALG